MTPAERQKLIDLRDGPMDHDGDWEMVEDVLHGSEPLDISHVGGEFEIVTDLRDGLWARCVSYPTVILSLTVLQ